MAQGKQLSRCYLPAITDLAGYIRVSRVGGREGESFISPAVQRERCEALAAAQGNRIAIWHEDLDFSGATSERPGLQAVLEQVEDGTVKGVVVWKLSRFGRSASDIHRNLERLRAAGGELYTVEEGINTSGAIGRFLLAIMAGLAELELEQRREGWETARERAVRRGVHVSSRTPTGYTRGDGGRLVVDPVSGPAVRRAFEAKAAGASWAEVGAVLERASVATSYGGRHWTAQSLKALISNRAYLGEARSGKFQNAEAHEPLVDPETFTRAQRTVGAASAASAKGGALLSGLLRCAGCSFTMKPDHMRSRRGEKVRIYRCRGRFSFGDCQARASVTGSIVEPWVEGQFFDRIPDFRLSAVGASDEIAEAQIAREQAELELIAYRDAESALGPHFLPGLAERVQALEGAELRLSEARRAAGVAELPDVETLRGAWSGMTLQERRQVLSGGIDAVFLRSVSRRNTLIGERAIVLWRGEAPDDLPSLSRRSFTPRPFVWG